MCDRSKLLQVFRDGYSHWVFLDQLNLNSTMNCKFTDFVKHIEKDEEFVTKTFFASMQHFGDLTD